MNYHNFLKRVKHGGKINVLVRKAMYIDNPYGHERDLIKEGGVIDSEECLVCLSGCDILPLGEIDGNITGLGEYGLGKYSFYLAIGGNGTTFIMQDMLARLGYDDYYIDED